MKQQSAEQTPQLPSLRIAYKNKEIGPEKRKGSKKSKSIQKERNQVVKEPLPLFDDYKFKAKDYDPL
jgi:hypothetical protein